MPADRVVVEFSGYAHEPAGEAFIEAFCCREERVRVDVVLADGRDATARLSAAEWEWLELNAGDIVPIRYPCTA